MRLKNIQFKNLILILLLVCSSIVFMFAPEIQTRLHLLQFKDNTYRILYLVNDLSENYIPTAKSTRVYSTFCTLGLSESINSTFDYLTIHFESEWFETDKFGDLNATYLDSFDLIVTGGILYWWQYASDNDRTALTLTKAPIISSAYIGIYPDLNNLTGVYTNKTSPEAWSTSVLPLNHTLIRYYTDILNEYSSERRIRLIDVIATSNATTIAIAFRGNETYPYLIKTGKNYYINTYTYPKMPIALDISIILDSIFNLYPDAYFDNIKHSSSRILNTLLIPAVIMASSLLFHNPIKIKKDRKLKLQLNLKKTGIAISTSTLLLLMTLLLFLLASTYCPQISVERHISIELLFTSVLFVTVLDSIVLNKQT